MSMSETARLRKEAARGYRRIAELEAKATADRKYMDKAEARIAELEQFNAQLKANLNHEDEKRRAVETERTHLATMLEIAAEDEWHDSFTIDPLDDYSETWLICLGVRANKKEARDA